MRAVYKIHKDGTVTVPRPLLKEAGLRPGIGIAFKVSHHSLIIEPTTRPLSSRKRNNLKELRGSLRHIDWDLTRRQLRERWSVWRNRFCA